ncbi:MAG: hypothetical protein A4E53_00571 [Pelotomaculum sp. PtaB.Bin104]|uniref:Copper amine oxidase N-terminal domain-containing protein n=1 Tax=Pelotomaculum isophthalicicum JI TaxID=947010 RepID=A0A9X4JWF4_9FIRM|nr:stalk domain-containing protein [Pelotomaculum isophthalicicum]MDF9410031.1 copper amine oxidase N-terminal domain-containing protein [Pelotomaculum isophthalicicum JI]OPX92230.1 MAG: hypothetical protein A4E53_00571 [Pelotomaculum sp. PtaB.Bin104]
MKKYIFGVIIGIFLTVSAMAFGDPAPIKIMLDGREIVTETPPQIINDRTFVPLRVISEAMGFDVKWDSAARTVILTSPEKMGAFRVVSYEKIDTDYGYAILGEVKNNSKSTFSKAKIEAEVIDAEGNMVEKLASTLPPGITPGETAYFMIRAISDKSNLYKAVNFSFQTSEECSVTPTDVTFHNLRFAKDQGILNDFIYVTGEVERTDKDISREYKHPVVQVALFDADGKMVNYGEEYMENYKLSRYGSFTITLDKGADYAASKLKCFSD